MKWLTTEWSLGAKGQWVHFLEGSLMVILYYGYEVNSWNVQQEVLSGQICLMQPWLRLKECAFQLFTDVHVHTHTGSVDTGRCVLLQYRAVISKWVTYSNLLLCLHTHAFTHSCTHAHALSHTHTHAHMHCHTVTHTHTQLSECGSARGMYRCWRSIKMKWPPGSSKVRLWAFEWIFKHPWYVIPLNWLHL